MSDPRENLPSASSVERYSLCPGSWNLCRSLPKEDETRRDPNDDAASGTRIHAELAGQIGVSLTEDERATADKCISLWWELLTKHEFKPSMTTTERRLWLHDDALNKILSGQPDIVVANGRRAVIVDWKTGRNESTEAAGNQQLRTLAVLVAEHYDVDQVIVAIIQPHVSPQVTTAFYNADDLARARIELLELIEAIQKPDAPRRAGEKQCRYCRGRAICPEAQEVVNSVALLPDAELRILTPERTAQLLDACARAEDVIEAIRAHAKDTLAAGGTIPGWTMKPGAVRDTITNPQLVFGRFIERGGTVEQFMPAVTVKKGELKSQLKAVTGEKGKTLDASLESMLTDATETKQAAPALARVKP